jgi:hypothetical protein
MSLSDRGERILRRLKEKNEFGVASTVYRVEPPRGDWWRVISNAAKKVAPGNDPYYEAVNKLALRQGQDSSFPGWPEGLYEIEPSLPAISTGESLAILDKFMVLEVGPP